MRYVRYIAAQDNKVCQIQYNLHFIQDVIDYVVGLAKMKKSNGPELSLSVCNNANVKAVFGDILHDDRSQGEFYEVEEGEIYDGLPDETSFSEDSFISFTNIIVSSVSATFIGYDDIGDEISAEILINDLRRFV